MSTFKLTPFEYEKKESYSQADVDKLFAQNQTYFETAFKVATSKMAELEAKNGEYTAKERQAKMSKLAQEVSPENFEKILKYVKVADDASDEDIKKAMEDAAKDFTPVISTATPKVETAANKAKPVSAVASDKYKDL